MSIDQLTGGNIEPRGLEEEMRSSYLDYAMSVIVGRALPDVRDGLKPVHRRVLFSMHEAGLQPNRPFRKSSRVVGDVMGQFHPHGDAAIYDALVRLGQDFAMRYPLIDPQGNFGSIDNDPPAAMRYSEARLARLATEMLRDIDADTVEFGPNYDESRQEPLVLPSRFPNLLVNGSSGIAVGMATNIPPHNLGEAIDAAVAYIDDPDLDVKGLMKHVKGPDFPTGGIIVGRGGIREAYETGRGRVVIRGRAHIEPLRQGKEAIIVTEMPYQVAKGDGRGDESGLIKKIAEQVQNGRLNRDRAEVAEPEDRRPVGDDRHRVALDGQTPGVARVLGQGQADPGHPGRVDHRQVVAVADRDLRLDLDLAAEVHQEGAVGDLADGDALDLGQGLGQPLGVLGVAGRAGDVDPQPLVAGRRDVQRGDDPTGLLDRVGQLADRVPAGGDVEPDGDRVRDARHGDHGSDRPRWPVSRVTSPASRRSSRPSGRDRYS